MPLPNQPPPPVPPSPPLIAKPIAPFLLLLPLLLHLLRRLDRRTTAFAIPPLGLLVVIPHTPRTQLPLARRPITSLRMAEGSVHVVRVMALTFVLRRSRAGLRLGASVVGVLGPVPCCLIWHRSTLLCYMFTSEFWNF